MIFKNARVYLPDFVFQKADVKFENGKIIEVASHIAGEGEDLAGRTLLPGFVDIHSHGCVGCDWSRASQSDYRKMAAYYAKNGVTSLLATTMSLPGEVLCDIMKEIKAFKESEHEGAYLHGINMEGPFFSKKKKGAQAEENIIDPDEELFERLWQASGGTIKLCDLAPELPGAMDFIAHNKGRCTLSIAHTDADYDTAMAAVRQGARHITHLYNAMTPFTHRAPGVVGAAFDSDAVAEMISDGIHLNPAVVRISFQILGSARIALISDSMEACGMPNGQYELGGQAVQVQDGLATLCDGTIAGSATNQFECCRRAIRFGVPAEEAVRAATHTPAKSVGVQDLAGSIQAGSNADFVVVDDEYTIQKVLVKGREVSLA